MRKQRTEPTLIQKAIDMVPGFQRVFAKLQQQVTLRGQSQSTLSNYIRHIAIITIHVCRLPEAISDDELNEFSCSLTTLYIEPGGVGFVTN